MRIIEHPILGKWKEGKRVTISVDGKKIQAYEGEPIAAALIASGHITFRTTEKRKHPRGFYCGIGLCTDCMMTVDQIPNIRTCITPVRENMQIQTQTGTGRWDG